MMHVCIALDQRATDQPVTGDGVLISAKVMALTRRIKVLIEKGDRAAEKAEQFYTSAGIHIKEIKGQSEDWESIVRDKCGVGRSRAYELMAIADGKTTLEKVRADTNERMKIHRAKSESVPERTTVTASPEISIEQRRADNAPLDAMEAPTDFDHRVYAVAYSALTQLRQLGYSETKRFFAALHNVLDDAEREVLRRIGDGAA